MRKHQVEIIFLGVLPKSWAKFKQLSALHLGLWISPSISIPRMRVFMRFRIFDFFVNCRAFYLFNLTKISKQ
jgi:hypothetical protein